MTTGSRTWDEQRVVSTQAGNGKVGQLRQKSWSGGDDTSGRAAYELVKTQYYTPTGRLRTYAFRNYPKRARKKGEHNYSCTFNSAFDTVGSFYQLPNGPWFTCTALNFAGQPSSQQRWNSNDDIAMLGKLRERIVGSDFNVAVMLAEAPEALQTIAHAALTIDRAYRAAKRGNVKEAGKILLGGLRRTRKGVVVSPPRERSAATSVAGRWLELQYAWLPLLNDVYGAACTLAHFTNVPFQQTILVRRKRNGTMSSASPNTKVGSSTVYTSVQIKAIISEVNVPGLLGLTDPASVAWEKLPWSFVADWFIPVGNWLSARGLAQNVSGTFVTSKKIYSDAVGCVSGAVPVRGLGTFRSTSGSLNRVVSTSLAVPKPEVKSLDQVLSWKHAANAVSLLISRFSK